MAFCTTCGASVTGAFCSKCGTPAAATAGQATTPSPPPPAAAAQRKTSPIVWVLIVVLGIFIVGFLGIVGTGFFVLHKAREAGFDSELMKRNPGLAISKMIAAVNPDVEVISTDDGRGTITIRDKRSGKVVTMTFDDVKNGKFKFSAEDGDGKSASVEVGSGAASHLPSWVPSYPGSNPAGTLSAHGDDGKGEGEGGIYSFTTKDPPGKVIDFFQDKAKGIGMTASLTANHTGGGVLMLADEDKRRTLQVTVSGGSDETTVSVTYAVKR